MLEDGDLLLLPDLVEVVHVQLPHEGRELLVLEVLRQDLVLEQLLVLHDEAVTALRPLYDVPVLLLLQDAVGLHDEVGNLLFSMDALLAVGPLRLLAPLRHTPLHAQPQLLLLHLNTVLRLLLSLHMLNNYYITLPP